MRDFLPIPDILQMRRILCVQPHPDDADIGCGGTLARLAASGAEIVYLTMTDGSSGTHTPNSDRKILAVRRRTEQHAALKALGMESAKLFWFDEPDGYLKADFILRDRLIRLVRRLQPDCIVTVDPASTYEIHGDHRVTGLLAARAAYFASYPAIAPQSDCPAHAVSAIGFYFTPHPNTYVDISNGWAAKLNAIQCHQSQFGGETWPQYAAFFDAQARQWGTRQGCERAEALKMLTPLHLHCFPDTMDS
ncbi:MAG: PIG-L deacetylase family protein [Cyanobacteria bacterium P01_D01_bin.123]